MRKAIDNSQHEIPSSIVNLSLYVSQNLQKASEACYCGKFSVLANLNLKNKDKLAIIKRQTDTDTDLKKKRLLNLITVGRGAGGALCDLSILIGKSLKTMDICCLLLNFYIYENKEKDQTKVHLYKLMYRQEDGHTGKISNVCNMT